MTDNKQSPVSDVERPSEERVSSTSGYLGYIEDQRLLREPVISFAEYCKQLPN